MMARSGSRAALFLKLLLSLALLCVARPACAQDTGIAVERFAPAAGPGSFAQVEAGAVPLPGQFWLTAALTGIGRPLVLSNALTGDEVAVPVRYRATLDVGGELGIWRSRLSLGIGVPLSAWQSGDRLTTTGVASNDSTDTGQALQLIALGDIRLRLKARLTAVESPLALAVIFELTVPGGGQSDFVATSSMTAAPHLVGSFRHRWLVGGLNLAVRFMSERMLYNTDLHDQLEWGAALGAILPVRRVGLGLYTEAMGFLNLVSPSLQHGTELRAALRLGWFRGTVDFGGGAGFGTLAPEWRAFVLLRTFFGESGITGCAARPITF